MQLRETASERIGSSEKRYGRFLNNETHIEKR
jgi:hypothetical protein